MALFDSGNGSYLKSAQKFEITEGLVDEIFIKVFEELKKNKNEIILVYQKLYSKELFQKSTPS